MIKIVWDKEFNYNNFKMFLGAIIIFISPFSFSINMIKNIFSYFSFDVFSDTSYQYFYILIGCYMIFTNIFNVWFRKIKHFLVRIFLRYKRSNKAYILRYIDAKIEDLNNTPENENIIIFLKQMKKDLTI